MSAIGSISRQLVTQNLTASASINNDTDQVLCDCTSGAITATLFVSPNDGALHQVIVEKTDSSANAVTVTDGTFTFTLSNQYDTVICQLTQAGVWFGVSGFDRSGTGNVDGPSSAVADDIVTFNGTTGKIIKDSGIAATTISSNLSTSNSAATSNSVVISSNLTTANSAVASQSLLISTADSKAVSDSVVISTLTTTANSKDTSSNLRISIVASTANSA